jgi:hypothetical protein
LYCFLDPGELAKANDRYVGDMDKLKFRKNAANLAKNWTMQSRVRAHHETLNRLLNNWGILSRLCHHISPHGDLFRVCAVLTQLIIKKGEPLYTVEYKE